MTNIALPFIQDIASASSCIHSCHFKYRMEQLVQIVELLPNRSTDLMHWIFPCNLMGFCWMLRLRPTSLGHVYW